MKLSLVALLSLVACLLLAACGSTGSDAPTNTAGQDGLGTESMPDNTMAGAIESDGQEEGPATDPSYVQEGSNVGERIPAFYFNDASLTKVTSEELFARGRPAFFYFFTTW